MNDFLRGVLSIFVGPRVAGRSVPVRAQSDQQQAVLEPSQKKVEKGTKRTSGLRFSLRFLAQDKAALVGMIVIFCFLVYGGIEGALQVLGGQRNMSLGYLLTCSNPIQFTIGSKLSNAPPTLKNVCGIFGYDYYGKSILAQLLYATPKDAFAAVVVVLSGVFIGLAVGIPAGYLGGWLDEILMRVTDAFLAFPFLLLAIAFSVLLGEGYTVVLIALVLIWWPTYARYFRAQAVTLRSRGFVDASKLSQVGTARIMWRHIFPNSIDPVIAQATLDFGSVIVLYSTLAFLGIGVQPGQPEWGAMTSAGISFFPNIWWWAVIPGLVITIVVVSFSLIGDRVQDLVGGRITY